MKNFKENLKLAKNKAIERLLMLISLLTLANLILFPHIGYAATEKALNTSDNANISYSLAETSAVNSLIRIINPEVIFNGNIREEDSHLPVNGSLNSKYTKTVVLTAYNSEIGQTDDTPCITANGFNVCKNAKEDTIAVNGMKFGTRVRFPEIFGNRVFVVRDRMNARYDSSRADVWMLSKADAKKFGVRIAKMEVLE